MESLVSYGSDDESNENYQDKEVMDKEDKINRQEDDDNYDNVQMDMSEESNNNHSGSSDSEDKSSSGSSDSSESAASDRDKCLDRERSNNATVGSAFSKEKCAPANFKDKEMSPKRKGNNNRLSPCVRHEPKKAQSPECKIIPVNTEHTKRSCSPVHRKRPESQDRGRRSHSSDRRRHSRSPLHKRRSRSPDRRRRSKSADRKRRSPERKRRSRSPEQKKRSRTPDHRRKSRSPERKRRSRSPPGHSSRHKERDRRSRSPHRRGYEKKPNKLTILERLGIEIKTPSGTDQSPSLTPQQLLQRSVDEQVQQVKASTGIEFPKYYNPSAMNPARYAEQMQKRKLLWGKKAIPEKKEESAVKAPVAVSNNKWEGTTFAQDQDGKMTAKFKRLMGIKDTAQGTSTAAAAPDGSEIIKKQEEMFNSMEMQYEVARVATHTHRGLGLGFGTFQYPR